MKRREFVARVAKRVILTEFSD